MARRFKLLVLIGLIVILVVSGVISYGRIKAMGGGAHYITLKTNLYFEIGKLDHQEFVGKVARIAISLMPNYDKVMVQFFVNENGTEAAVIILESKKHK